MRWSLGRIIAIHPGMDGLVRVIFNPKTAFAAANELSEFKHGYQPLPHNVAEAVRPIYTDLSNDKLLERWVGGFTQNIVITKVINKTYSIQYKLDCVSFVYIN